MKRIFYTAFFVIMAICPMFTHAQDTLDTDKSSKTNKLLGQIAKYVSIGGWIDAQYAYDRMDDANQSSVFQIRRARLDVKASLSRWVDFRLQVDFAPSPRLIDAFVKVNLCKYVNLQVGQFKIPFSLENILSPLDLELIENAQVISALSGYKDVTGIGSYSNGREIGLMLMGTLASAKIRGEDTPILTYGVGLFGGNGINVKTDNMAKDISARINFCPFVKHLTLSVSGYWGKYDMLYEGEPTHIDGARIRYGGGVQYADEHWMVRSEYLWGRTDFANYDEVDDLFVPHQMMSHGAYITIGHWFMMGWGKKSNVQQKIRPLVRIDYFEKDMSAHAPSMFYSVGADWWPEKHLRVQLAYTLRQINFSNQLGHNLTTMISVKF